MVCTCGAGKPNETDRGKAMKMRIGQMAATAGLAFGLALTGAFQATAEDPIATTLDTSEAQGYIGLWKLTIDIVGTKMDLFLNIADVGGKVGATLDVPDQPEPLAITEILKGEDGLEMNSEFAFAGAIKLTLNIKAHLDGDGLAGTIKDVSGIFSSDMVGVRFTQDELDSVQGHRAAPTETRLRVGDKQIRIDFASLKTGTPDWDLFQNVKVGDVFGFTESRATKIYTDFDLGFGGVVIKKENYTPNYPGVYSLWLKRTADGWNLVFNSQPDIWGTRHLAEHDVAEIPLTVSKTSGEAKENFVVRLDKHEEERGVLMLAWGDLEWSAQFSVIQ